MTEFRHATLSNGLRVVGELDRRAYSAALGYFVAAGARHETDPESGLSHFLEHMMFKGTAKRTAADVNRELDELGGQSNAYTSEETTVYYAAVLPKFQDRAVELLTDILSPTLDEDEFQMERNVILEEIAKYEDQPPFGAFERAMELHFTPRGLGRRVLGTEASIRDMSAARMREYFFRRYRPENIVLAATGNVDFDGLVAEAERLTDRWRDRPIPATPTPDVPDRLPDGISLETQLEIPDAAQSYLVQLVPGPTMSSQDRYVVRMLASILGDEGGSRMFWDLIDTGRAEVATLWSQEFAEAGAIFRYLVCGPEEMESNRRLTDEIVERASDAGIRQQELSEAINKTVAGCIMQSERPSGRLFGLGTRWLIGEEYIGLDDLLDRYRRVTVESVGRAARDYLTHPPTTVLAAASNAEQRVTV